MHVCNPNLCDLAKYTVLNVIIQKDIHKVKITLYLEKIGLANLYYLNVIKHIDIMRLGKHSQRIDTLHVKRGMEMLIPTLVVAPSTCILVIDSNFVLIIHALKNLQYVNPLCLIVSRDIQTLVFYSLHKFMKFNIHLMGRNVLPV